MGGRHNFCFLAAVFYPHSPAEPSPTLIRLSLYLTRRDPPLLLLLVFAFSMFVSAGLLFLVEPMVAKMVLPLLGGTPSVWNTALVFFQAVLLAGYLYAWAMAKWLGRRTQIIVHLAVAIAVLADFPPHIPAGWEPPAQSNPVW